VELGEKVQNAEKLAPTRPHPSAPHSELFHKTVGQPSAWWTGCWIS
jgi:hypothetical protein